jgi:DNA-binding MarR family transcriptional regulator
MSLATQPHTSGLTVRQFQVLTTVLRCPGVTSVANLSLQSYRDLQSGKVQEYLPEGRMLYVMLQLVELGLVSRTMARHPKIKRIVQTYYLTEQGRELLRIYG